MVADFMPKPIDDLLVLMAIDKGLSALGDSPKKALLFYLEKDFGLDWQEIPKNIATFEEVLKKFFGLGYNFLDSLFRQSLQEASGVNLQSYRSFADCVSCLSAKLQPRDYTSAQTCFLESSPKV